MSLLQTHVLSRAKARPIILLPVALLVVTIIGYLIFTKPKKERLINELTAQLTAGKFEQLYEEAGNNVHLNVTKGKFVQRMRTAVTKLKAIDENLSFQTDTAMEAGFPGDEILIRSFQKLEKDGKSVSVLFHWDPEGNFFDLSVLPDPGTSEEYGVLGVSAKSYSVGNQVLDW
jgi:hypothetical protein